MGVVIMQMCPDCDSVYDESEYSRCPYCSGELKRKRTKYKNCPECLGTMYWHGYWKCEMCGNTIHTGIDDYDDIG